MIITRDHVLILAFVSVVAIVTVYYTQSTPTSVGGALAQFHAQQQNTLFSELYAGFLNPDSFGFAQYTNVLVKYSNTSTRLASYDTYKLLAAAGDKITVRDIEQMSH